MIIICGAGSKLAKHTIKNLSDKYEIIAISRNEKHKGKNITNINIQNYDDLPEIIENLSGKNYVWINYVAYIRNELFLNVSNEDLKEDQKINFDINFNVSKILIPKMINDKFGRFIFISSSGALQGDVGIFSYSLGKRSNLSLQDQIVMEYSRFGITANTLSLGFFDTKLWNRLDDKLKKNLLNRVPNKRLSDPACIAPTIELLINQPSLNNNILKLDDGFR